MSLAGLRDPASAHEQSLPERLASLYERLHVEGSRLRCCIEALPPPPSCAPGPLSGAAFGVKDCIDLAGRAPTLGMARSPLAPAERDAEIVEAFRRLGATPLAATNMDELAIGSSGENRHYGNTLNPSRPGEPAGGSSGGSAAAVAAGLLDFALGTDFGGSTRIPGARCGLWALKLSAGALARGAHLIEPRMDALGLLARSGEDMQILCEALALISDETAHALVVPLERDMQGADPTSISAIRIIAANHGLPSLEVPFERASEARKLLAGRAFSEWLERLNIADSELSKAALATKIYGARLTGESLDNAREEQSTVRERILKTLGHGHILCPALGDSERFLTIANLCGLPALCFPCSGSHVQLVGPKGSEIALVRAARNLIRD